VNAKDYQIKELQRNYSLVKKQLTEISDQKYPAKPENSLQEKTSNYSKSFSSSLVKADDLSAMINTIALEKECNTGHLDTVTKLVFIENGSKYVTCSKDATMNIFTTHNNEYVRTLHGHTGFVYDMIMLSNGYLCSCSVDKSIKLWNVTEGKCIKTLNGHTDQVTALCEAPNSILISGSNDKTVRLWDLNNNNTPSKIVQNSNQLEVAFHALHLIDDNLFAVGSHNDINIYKITQSVDVLFQKKLSGHTDFVYSMETIKSKEILISGSLDKTCKAWNINTGECIKTFIGHTDRVWSLTVLSENVFISSSKEVNIWDFKSDRPIKTLNQNDKWICHLAVNQDSKLFTCGVDTKVRIYK